MLRIKDKARIWTCLLTAVLTLCASVADARNITFAWDSSQNWTAGTTVELEANGVSANGITGTQYVLDVPVQPGEVISARARAIPPTGYQCGDPLEICPPSPWSESLVQTVPPDPTGLWSTKEPIGGGGVMAAPTFVSQYATAFNSTTTPKTAMSAVAINSNDVLVAVASSANSYKTLSITENGAASATLQRSSVVVDYSPAYGWTYVAPSAETITISFSSSGGSGEYFGGNIVRFSGSDGVGASNVATGASGNPSVSLTTTQANSAIVVIVSDWNAVSGTQTFTNNFSGTPTALTDYPGDGAQYGVAIAYFPDAGAVGSKTVGMSAPTGQKWTIIAIEVKGSTSTTVTATTGIDALVQKTGITATSSLGALLQKSFSGTVSIDSIISAIKTGSISIDALLNATNKSATVSVDGLLQAVRTGAVSIDAAIAIIVAATSGVDALLQSSFSATSGLDAIVSGSSTVTASLDGLLQSGKSTTALIDALLQTGYLSQTGIDAIISKTFSATASLDALLQSGAITSTSLDAIISGGSSASVVLDALLQSGVVSTASIDALIQKPASVTASMDAFIQGSASAVAALDGLLQGAKTGTLSLDAIIVSAGEALATTALDGLLQALKTGTLSLDALVAVPVAGATASLDALLSVTGVSTVNLGALLQSAKTGIISIDGLVQSAKTAPVSIDGLVQSAKTGTVSLDSIVGIIGSAAISLDGILQKSRASGVFLDAIIGLISSIIMPTGRVISITPTDRYIVISETDRFIVIPNSDRSVLN
ncbi:MAG: hypothetical protein IPK79_14085 [Vampirovibrionales bacterium]|nr:hypothetical protein [Vampirovibrionales bacterium]